ncbi:hypothetical protein [Halobacteriovorax sp. JY17]|uniref:hypothetical protein n=1 Tax=Halobacteriovorax sp. JY17 TaxID=2014617 RepID=UPI000C567B91|nr:hypothetical protein [Halobacteriovorax sp. JY17]PIK14868.1 MAG: hypothetical protein CES88_11085 [Halobacteriovorax sp. JY17]
MMKIIGTLLLITYSSVFAANFKGKEGALNISFSNQFKTYKNFLGLPYVLIKKEQRSKKTSISITPTGLKSLDLNPMLLQKNYDKYKIGRKNWAKKRGFKIDSYLEFDSFKNKTQTTIFSAGYIYTKKDSTQNIEVSYYIICKNETFQIKVLTENVFYTNPFSKMLRSSLSNSRCK